MTKIDFFNFILTFQATRKKVWDNFLGNPVNFFLIALLVVGLILLFLDYKSSFLFLGTTEQNENDWRGVLTEGHGMLFDIIVLGVLLAIYDLLREKGDKKERYREEIEDYRGWNEKEASYRIVGLIKRLNRIGETNINLNDCYLGKANLKNCNLEGAGLLDTNLNHADLSHSNLKNSNLFLANLSKAKLLDCKLNGAILDEANLENAQLFGADFTNASLKKANLKGVKIIGLGVNTEAFQQLNAVMLLNIVKNLNTNALLKNVNLQDALAFEYQKAELELCGADTSTMHFSPNEIVK